MQFLQPSFKLLQNFLNDNPELTEKYVDTSVNAISHLLGPLNVFMRHLLVVKGLDPNTHPGEKAAKQLQQAMNQAFEDHQKAYDDDYDFSWVQKRFDETRKHLKDLQLTKEKFLDLTDLAKLPVDDEPLVGRTAYEVGTLAQVSAREVNEVAAPAALKREIPFTSTDKEYEKAVNTLKEVASKLNKFNPLTDLRDALSSLEKEVASEKSKPAPKKKSKTTKAPRVVKVSVQNAASEDITQKKVELLKQMIADGLCSPDEEDTQRQEMDKWSNDSLESMKRILDRHVKPYPGSKNADTKFKGSFRRAPKAQ